MADYEETMVETEDSGEEVEEILPDGIVEEEDEDGPEESLSSIIGEDEGESSTEEQEAQPGKQGTSEPGYVQGRIAKAVSKALAEERGNIKAEVMAELEAQYAPIRERLLEMDARELVRYRNNQPQAAKKDEPARNVKGQYVSKEQLVSEAKTEARIVELKKQAARIKAKGGPDVVSEFMNNSEVKRKVINEEMDFYELAEEMEARKKKPPTPMRSPNGANAQAKGTIMSLSDKQFDELVKRVQEGARIRE